MDIGTELGIATTRVEDRILHIPAEVKFENSQSVWGGGVLFLLPSLLLQGLLKTKEVYNIPPMQIELRDQIKEYQNQENQLLEQRKSIKPKITISSMPDQIRYNKLKTESKLLMNVIKMIAYRAESVVASLISPSLSRADNEKRMLVKQIIATSADIEPDHINKTLTITLHTLSANRYNVAAQHLADLLNDSQTIFPSTDLRMIFKISAFLKCER